MTYMVVSMMQTRLADKYEDYKKMVSRIANDSDISKRQKETILEGICKLKESIETISNYIKIKV